MVFGRRSQIINQQAAVRAAQHSRFYRQSTYRHSRIILPPRKVQAVVETLPLESQETLGNIGLQIAERIDPAKPLEEQLPDVEAFLREQFEAIVQPIAESVKAAVAETLQAYTEAAKADESSSEAEGTEEDEPSDERSSMEYVAAGVLILGAALGVVSLGAELSHRHYANASLWALAYLLALTVRLRKGKG